MWGTVADTGEAETMRWVDVDDFDRVCLCVCVCVCLERAGALQSPAASLTPLGFPTPYLLTKDGTHVGLGHVVAAGASKKKEAKPGSDVRSFGCQVKFSRTKKKETIALSDRPICPHSFSFRFVWLFPALPLLLLLSSSVALSSVVFVPFFFETPPPRRRRRALRFAFRSFSCSATLDRTTNQPTNQPMT